jgi:UDP-glucose 4-epimerase
MLQSKHSERPFILVTGGCGYIGANLINVLSTHGYRVRVLDDFSNGFAERLIGLDAEIIEGSLLDLDCLNKSLIGVDLVVHLAAKKSVSESQKNPEYYSQQNVIATKSLLVEMSKNSISKLIFV